MKERLYAKKIKIAGALAGILSPIIALIAISYAIYSSPNFSFGSNALSDLGANSFLSPFNIGVMISGMLFAIFFISLAYLLKNSRTYSALGAIGAISLEMLGVFNEAYPVHTLFSIIYFFLAPIAVIGISLNERRIPDVIKKYGFAAGTVSILSILIGIAMLNAGPSYGIGFAVNESIEAVLLAIWAIIFGYLLLSKKDIIIP